jgi:phospholipid/cholesterol/gamma-HCH transport system substrate-binding protein
VGPPGREAEGKRDKADERRQRLRRIAGFSALAGAILIVAYLVLSGPGGYKVTAAFENASQLVEGNQITVAGVPAGTVSDISLADDGQALVEMEVSEEYAPLPQGTHATVRSQSLSGIANRYVDLDLPEAPAEGSTEQATIEDGGTIEQVNTTSEVDLDQLFNTLDEKTISSFKSVVKGFARSYDGVGPQANKGFRYLNPFLSTSRRVFSELNSDEANLDSLLVDTASLTGALAERSDDVEALVGNIDTAFGAIGRRERELAASIGLLPDFMRQFNTTAFNLRAALDDVDPLVKASRPVARKLKPFVRNLRGFAQDAVPAVLDLDGIVRRDGPANDLIELTELQVPLAEIGAGPVTRNGRSREGALPAAATSLGTECPGCDGEGTSDGGLKQLIHLRPYITEEAITGWFDDFSHSGTPDAIGGMGRINATFNTFTPAIIPGNIPLFDLTNAARNPLSPLTQLAGLGLQFFGNSKRCPGANVTGSQLTPEERSQLNYQDDPFQPEGGLDCDPQQTLPGN